MVAKSNIQRILVILMVFMVSSSLHTYAQDDTPPPPSEITFTLKDNVDSLRVRSGAGTDFAVLGILDASTVDTFVIDPQKYDPNSDWIEGTFGETQTGFIYADYTDVTLNTPTGTSLNPLQRAASWNNPTPSPTPAAEQQVIGRSNAQASGNNSSAENSNASTQGVEVAVAPVSTELPREFYTQDFNFRTLPYYDYNFEVDNSVSNSITGADGVTILRDGVYFVGSVDEAEVPPEFAWPGFITDLTFGGDYPDWIVVTGPTASQELSGVGKILFGIDTPSQGRIELGGASGGTMNVIFVDRSTGQVVQPKRPMEMGEDPSTQLVFGPGYFTAPINGEVIRIENGDRLLALTQNNIFGLQSDYNFMNYTGGSSGGLIAFHPYILVIPVDQS